MINAQFDELLKNNQPIVRTITGYSMYPTLINHKDVVIIEPLRNPLRVNDVVIYKSSKQDVYILHRIMRIKGNELVIRGDNNNFNEHDYTKDDILGIMTGFYKGNKYIDCETNKSYKFYVWFWRYTYYPREFFIKPIYRFVRRTIGKILRILRLK